MKTKIIIISVKVYFMLAGIHLVAQSTFDPAIYKQFLLENQTLTATELLENNPPKTSYYSSRSNPTSLSYIPWYDSIHAAYKLTKKENELLANHHFMVTQRIQNNTWAGAFINIYTNDLPLFISTDFILYTLHNAYDAILQTLEWQFLEPNLIILLEALYNSYPSLYDTYKSDTRLGPALEDVDLYVSVARSLLLDQTYAPQKHNIDQYNAIMDAISAEQMKEIKLFTETRNRKIDFSQFKPRSHYNKEFYTPDGPRTLENYFRAMMWLGRIDFLLTAPPENPWEPDWTDDELRRMQLGALLLNELLSTCGKKDLLDTHEEIISYLVGPDDNLTPDELDGLSDNILSAPTDLFYPLIFDQFMDSLNASDDYGQKIMSNFFFVDPLSSDPGKLPVSFKLLGQKFLIDSYITSEVVYDRIIHNGKKIHRDLPDPLDVMAVLGNENAMALMEDEMETYKYAYKISSLKHLVDAYDESFWSQSLYNTWLNSIRDLNPPESSVNLPWFMQTTAWHHEKLNTQLTSWAALRHDNILYGKQSYTGGTGCSYPFTYVEPYPDFYSRLAQFAEEAAAFFTNILASESFTSKEYIIEYYTRYAEIMDQFSEIAAKELEGTSLSEDEIVFLKTMINEYMASGPSITGWFNDLFFDTMTGLNFDFIVADIHTQPTDKYGHVVGHVYHVGCGYIDRGIFLAPNPLNPNQLMAFTGPVSSFHYEVTNDFYRYDDQEWEGKFLMRTGLPARPDWISIYMADEEGKELSQGRELKGEVYVATHTVPPQLHDIDYLITFPNPASQVVHLRFVLNTQANIHLEILDASGKMLKSFYKEKQIAGEHDIPIDISSWQSGFYLIKFKAGNHIIHRKISVL